MPTPVSVHYYFYHLLSDCRTSTGCGITGLEMKGAASLSWKSLVRVHIKDLWDRRALRDEGGLKFEKGGVFLAEGIMAHAKKLSLEGWCSVWGRVRIWVWPGIRVWAGIWWCVDMCRVGLLGVVVGKHGEEVGTRLWRFWPLTFREYWTLA